ncbi:hypothetical protein [Corynebacterium epidermidicanis]|uniref:ABC transporter n=1 Tax=Corynebacterium epidermidicanis TaxID=1050174 RepID=A0A0G3GRS5_9CORY|nr:hypothetical protein [Corynebacterium epidermidicanis]AKK03260.1 hypothetical protein CEPID_07010 [Corynebacterium epidermidicanis]
MSTNEEAVSPESPRASLAVRNLQLKTGMTLRDFEITRPYTLICTGRESSATTTMLTLAGRMRPAQGDIILTSNQGEEILNPRARSKHIALAGVNEIDTLDRNVTVRSLVRESAAWSNPWYARTPHDIDKIARWHELRELLNFTGEPSAQAGELTPSQRFNLRIILALMTRVEPQMLFIDDIDQVHSLDIRKEIVGHLRDVAEELPIVVASSNPDVDHVFDETIAISDLKEQA